MLFEIMRPGDCAEEFGQSYSQMVRFCGISYGSSNVVRRRRRRRRRRKGRFDILKSHQEHNRHCSLATHSAE
jgi:hypothetical protein